MSKSRACGARSEAGLTLLEVLGAFALLAILYTVLATHAIEGLRSEGESRRRLEASLIADERLAEIELELASGASPPTERAEEEREGFRIATEVKPLELPPRPEKKTAEEGSLAARRAARRREEFKDLPSLFAKPRTGTPPALLDIEVAVRWDDGIYEREVRRRTYAVDPTAVEAAFEAVAALQTQQPVEPEATEEGRRDPRGQQGQPGRQGRGSQKNPQPLQGVDVPLPDESGFEP